MINFNHQDFSVYRQKNIIHTIFCIISVKYDLILPYTKIRLMGLVKKIGNIPACSIILKGFENPDYYDVYSIRKQTEESVDEIATKIFSTSGWTDSLMKMRDSLVGILGLRTAKDVKINKSTRYELGIRAVLFTVVDRNEDEIVMGENDKHLNFRTSVYIERNSADTQIYLSTLVKFNNIWGKLYFLPVKPFHRLIIKSSLKKAN
jgi:hypothetical protein